MTVSFRFNDMDFSFTYGNELYTLEFSGGNKKVFTLEGDSIEDLEGLLLHVFSEKKVRVILDKYILPAFTSEA